jgi:hypothetical protein
MIGGRFGNTYSVILNTFFDLSGSGHSDFIFLIEPPLTQVSETFQKSEWLSGGKSEWNFLEFFVLYS